MIKDFFFIAGAAAVGVVGVAVFGGMALNKVADFSGRISG